MVAAPSSIPSSISSSARPARGSVRNAEPRDAAELARLFGGLHVEAKGIQAALPVWLERGHVVVLEHADRLSAAAYVEIDHRVALPRARLCWLIVDAALDRVAARVAEDQMTRVALALCAVFGCVGVDTRGVDSGLTPRGRVLDTPAGMDDWSHA